MALDHVVTIGGSAGALDALRTLLPGLPPDFPAAVLVVIHTSPHSPGIMVDILQRASSILVAHAKNGERIQPGRVYIAPPDHHLVLEPGVMRLTKGPRENRFRPAIDPLFRSAAQVYGPRVIGVIISGSLDDGTAGLWAVKQLGGVTIVQDPDDADFSEMPDSAARHVKADYVLPLSGIAPLLVSLTGVPVQERMMPIPREIDIEVAIAKEQNAVNAGVESLGNPSLYACPECHGVLLRVEEGSRIRFRCHTGHAYSAKSLLAAAREATDEALWNAVRALEEGALLMNGLATHVLSHNREEGAAMMRHALEAHRRADMVRKVATESEAAIATPVPADSDDDNG